MPRMQIRILTFFQTKCGWLGAAKVSESKRSLEHCWPTDKFRNLWQSTVRLFLMAKTYWDASASNSQGDVLKLESLSLKWRLCQQRNINIYLYWCGKNAIRIWSTFINLILKCKFCKLNYLNVKIFIYDKVHWTVL